MSRPAPRLFSHVDLRVRDRDRAKAFYDAVFAPLGIASHVGRSFTTYSIDPSAPDADQEWFGFTEEPQMSAGSARISLYAETREVVDQIAEAAKAAGADAIEGPAVATEYGPNYYAVFFEDSDGNKLEVCCLA